MNSAGNVKTAGHCLDGDKEHLPFKMISECDYCMWMNLKYIYDFESNLNLPIQKYTSKTTSSSRNSRNKKFE